MAEPTRTVCVVKSMFVKRGDDGRRACHAYDVDSLVLYMKPSERLCEYLTNNAVTRVYFDYENMSYRSVEDVDIAAERSRLVNLVASALDVDASAVVVAEAHRSVSAESFKVSFRLFVPQVCCPYTALKSFIEAHPVLSTVGFDTSVYKPAEQLLNCIGCSKQRVGDRVFVITSNHTAIDTLVQYITGEERMLDVPTVCAPPVGRLAGAGSSRAVDNGAQSSQRTAPVRNNDNIVALLRLLSPKRWEDYAKWRDIATALKNDFGDKYREVWLNFSRISDKFQEDAARRLWEEVARDDFTGRRVTVGTLHKWARFDNPGAYAEYRMAQLPPQVLDLVAKNEVGLGEVAGLLLHERIKRVGVRHPEIFLFSEDKCCWIQCTEDFLHRPIVAELECVLTDVAFHYDAMVSREESQDKKKELQSKASAARTQIGKLYTSRDISSITREALPFFQDNEFKKRLDSIPYLRGVRNGVVDLRDGKLRARRPEDMLFTIIDVDYDPAADTSLIEKCLLEAMADDQELARFVKKGVGYGFTGESCEEVFLIFTGTGRNFKGTLMNTIEDLLGPRFYVKVHPGLLVEGRKVSNEDAEKHKLEGSLFAVINELNPGEVLNCAHLLEMTGGDTVPSRALYGAPTSLRPSWLLLMMTNFMPIIKRLKPSLVERILVMEFPVFFTNLGEDEAPTKFRRQRDNDLKRRLAENKAGVLTWLVQGAVEWYATKDLKRSAPAKVVEYSKKYLMEQDRVELFLKECCEIGEGNRVVAKQLLNAFNKWSEDRDGQKIASKDFNPWMNEKGYKQETAWFSELKKAAKAWINIKLKEEYTPETSYLFRGGDDD